MEGNFVYVTGKSLAERPEELPEKSIFQDDSTGFQYWFLDGAWRQANFAGLSTDTKPTDCPVNSWFHETDTDIHYQFDGVNWNGQSVSAPAETTVSEVIDSEKVIDRIEKEYETINGVRTLVKETVIYK